MKTILFPTDYSPAGNAALRYAVSLAKPSRAKLLIAYVEPPSLPPVGASLPESPTADEEASLAGLLQSLGDGGNAPPHEIRKLRGDPATEIVRLAKQEQADLIVMATAGRSGWRRVLMGSVAEAIVREAPCPVLTLNEPAMHSAR
jgi:universal stress protein A